MLLCIGFYAQMIYVAIETTHLKNRNRLSVSIVYKGIKGYFYVFNWFLIIYMLFVT